jgi:signal transduction histidine kinase
VERVKTDVLRLASHELRTPLTVLNGYLSLVEAGFYGDIPEPLAEVVAILRRRTAEMNSLVNDMLVASRVEDVPPVDEGEPVDLGEVLGAAVRDVAPRASAHHHLRLEVPERPVVVRVDRDRVALALRNVIDNAIKYSPAGGEVVCTLVDEREGARIRVRDHGLGIAAADRDKLFTRFGRVLTPDNSHIPGIGLGLYYSREVARRHGGDVRLVDGEGEGCTFEMTIPTIDDPAVRPVAAPGPSAS